MGEQCLGPGPVDVGRFGGRATRAGRGDKGLVPAAGTERGHEGQGGKGDNCEITYVHL